MREITNISKQGSNIGLRLNIVPPYDNYTGNRIIESTYKSYIPTIEYLLDQESNILIFTHTNPSEINENDTIHTHAEKLSENLNVDINVAKSDNISKIFHQMDEGGDITIYKDLNNIDGCMYNYNSIEDSRKNDFVEEVSSHIDAYVNDSFSLTPYNYPSITGVPTKVASYSGRRLFGNNKFLSELDLEKDIVFLFAGSEIGSKIDRIEELLNWRDDIEILTGGIIAAIFLHAEGYELGQNIEDIIQEQKNIDIMDQAKDIITRYKDKINLPTDLAIRESDSRKAYALSATPLPKQISDIGEETIGTYKDIINNSSIVIATGLFGLSDKNRDEIEIGTKKVYKEISEHENGLILGPRTIQVCGDELQYKGFSHSNIYYDPVYKYILSNKCLPGLKVLLPENQ